MAETSETSLNCIVCLEDSDDLRYMPCDEHRYCSGCFCSTLERAIHREAGYPIPCGDPGCPLKLEDVKTLLDRFTDIEVDQRDDMLKRYSSRLTEYRTPKDHRTDCSNQSCRSEQGEPRFLDVNVYGSRYGQRVLCPNCDTITCTTCKASVSPADDAGHVCRTDASGIINLVANLPEDERWKWHKCPNCPLWISKSCMLACNHMTCPCGYQYCVLCKGEWEGVAMCLNGCPKVGLEEHDSEGYNQDGYHCVTRLDRAGQRRARDALYINHPVADPVNADDGTDGRPAIFPWPGQVQPDDDDVGDEFLAQDDGPIANAWGLDADGFDIDGFDMYGIDRLGRDRNGRDHVEAPEALGHVNW